jgi:hypothetical protein
MIKLEPCQLVARNSLTETDFSGVENLMPLFKVATFRLNYPKPDAIFAH